MFRRKEKSGTSQGVSLLAVAEEVVLVLADLDGGAAELGDEDAVASADAHGDALAVAGEGAGADGKHLGLIQLLDAGLGQEDAAGGLGLGLDPLHQHPVQQRHQRLDRADGGGLFFGGRERWVVSLAVVVFPEGFSLFFILLGRGAEGLFLFSLPPPQPLTSDHPTGMHRS